MNAETARREGKRDMRKKEHHQSDFSFRLMSLEFRVRDRLRPPIKILREAGVQSGMTVLDFGCGPGGFSLAAARLVGKEGRVYAVDINPLALESVQVAAKKESWDNIHSLSSNRISEVPSESVDLALLYDVLHGLSRPDLALAEIHRVLKPGGLLSASDHHLAKDFLVSMITSGGLYRLAGRCPRTSQFEKMIRK
jgi:ubiquinone/menaquinone biosynthesis C-methylase UbiE